MVVHGRWCGVRLGGRVRLWGRVHRLAVGLLRVVVVVLGVVGRRRGVVLGVAGRLVGLLVGRLVGWLVGRLVVGGRSWLVVAGLLVLVAGVLVGWVRGGAQGAQGDDEAGDEDLQLVVRSGG